jgi:hypothetical protein
VLQAKTAEKCTVTVRYINIISVCARLGSGLSMSDEGDESGDITVKSSVGGSLLFLTQTADLFNNQTQVVST